MSFNTQPVNYVGTPPPRPASPSPSTIPSQFNFPNTPPPRPAQPAPLELPSSPSAPPPIPRRDPSSGYGTSDLVPSLPPRNRPALPTSMEAQVNWFLCFIFVLTFCLRFTM